MRPAATRRWGARCLVVVLCASSACAAEEHAAAEPTLPNAAAPEDVAPAIRRELAGDPALVEREILALGPADIPDDVLLSLPGSHGVPIAASGAAIAEGGRSVGPPDAGALEGGIQLPFDPRAYTRRDPTRAYATTRTLRTIQVALGALRNERGVDAEVVIGDISLPRGGAFAPHASHTSGRDIDIRLVLAAGLDRTTLPFAPEQVDWDATWSLVHSFLETGQVTYVFLDFGHQAHLHGAGLRAGVHPRVLDRWLEWPDAGDAQAIVRHEPGHRAHLHIRLSCAEQGPRCQGA